MSSCIFKFTGADFFLTNVSFGHIWVCVYKFFVTVVLHTRTPVEGVSPSWHAVRFCTCVLHSTWLCYVSVNKSIDWLVWCCCCLESWYGLQWCINNRKLCRRWSWTAILVQFCELTQLTVEKVGPNCLELDWMRAASSTFTAIKQLTSGHWLAIYSYFEFPCIQSFILMSADAVGHDRYLILPSVSILMGVGTRGVH